MSFLTLAAMPIWLFGILVLLVGGLAGAAAYYGVQSIRQGLLLQRVVPPGQLQNKLGQGIAVTGFAERRGDSHDPMKANALWIRTRVQEYRRSYSSSSNSSTGRWVTVSDETQWFPFLLRVGEHAVEVNVQATEVHGTQTRRDYYDSGGGFLASLFSSSRGSRTIIDTLYGGREITAVGRLSRRGDGSLSLAKDDALGLLLTGYAGSTQAYVELAKGVVGVLLPPAWLAGAVWAYQNYY